MKSGTVVSFYRQIETFHINNYYFRSWLSNVGFIKETQ